MKIARSVLLFAASGIVAAIGYLGVGAFPEHKGQYAYEVPLWRDLVCLSCEVMLVIGLTGLLASSVRWIVGNGSHTAHCARCVPPIRAINPSRLGQCSLPISYALFPVVLTGIVMFLICLDANKGELSFIPMIILLGLALSWQAFTIQHHKRRVMPYVFAIIYSVAFFASVLAVMF